MNVQNARQQSGQFYSGKIVTRDWPILRREINNEFIRISGQRIEHMPVAISDFELMDLYEDVRKGYYKPRAMGRAVVSERPLFNEIEGASLVYAHTALIAKYPNVRVIKIGYTEQVLSEYLAGKRIQCDPELLAFTIGDKGDERRYKRMWKQRGIVADGNEWLWPEHVLFEWIVEIYEHIEPDFWKLAKNAEETLHIYRRSRGFR